MAYGNAPRLSRLRAIRPWSLGPTVLSGVRGEVAQEVGTFGPGAAEARSRMLAHKNRVMCQEGLVGYERSCGSAGTKR